MKTAHKSSLISMRSKEELVSSLEGGYNQCLGLHLSQSTVASTLLGWLCPSLPAVVMH